MDVMCTHAYELYFFIHSPPQVLRTFSPEPPCLIKNGIQFCFRDFIFSWCVEPYTYFMLIQSIYYIKAKDLCIFMR